MTTHRHDFDGISYKFEGVRYDCDRIEAKWEAYADRANSLYLGAYKTCKEAAKAVDNYLISLGGDPVNFTNKREMKS